MSTLSHEMRRRMERIALATAAKLEDESLVVTEYETELEQVETGGENVGNQQVDKEPAME